MILNLIPIGFWMLEFGDGYDFWRPAFQYRDLDTALESQQSYEYGEGFCCRLREILYSRPSKALAEGTHNILCSEEAQINRRDSYMQQRKDNMKLVAAYRAATKTPN